MTTQKNIDKLGIGIIGAGYISCAHSIAFNSVAAIMEPNLDVHFAAACSPFPEELAQFKDRFNFSTGYEDWRDLVKDPAVDLVIIGSPPNLHFEQAKMALENGKHLLAEKPVAFNADECKVLYEIAKANNLHTAVGFTYLANPGMFLARELVEEKKLGEIYSFNGHFLVDDFAYPDKPWHWSCDEKIAGYGTTNDLGYHIVGKLVTLFGLPAKALGCRQTKVAERKDRDGKTRPVTSDDMASAILEYDNGISGTIQVSRAATGRDQFIHLEVNGSEGSFVLDMENMNHFSLYLREEDKRLEGFRRIMIGPEHKNYSRFCPADGHGLGFNDFIIIQNGHFLGEIAGTPQNGSDGETYKAIADLEKAWQVQKVIDAIAISSDTEKWMDIAQN